MSQRTIDDVTDAILSEAIAIHRRFGPGLMESFYEALLRRRLVQRGLKVERQKSVSLTYDGIYFAEVCRLDLVVESVVIVELKSVERLAPAHPKQLLTHLRVSDLRVGLLINFGGPTLLDGVRRVVNKLAPAESPILRVNQPKGADPDGPTA